MQRLGVMQVIDTLVAAGAERVAVNIANLLPRDHYRSYLCTTREEGPLVHAIASDVGRLKLERKATLDVAAIARLVKFIQANDIGVLHAHSSALFIARAAACFKPFPKVVWHAHYGRYVEDRRPVMYRLATRGIAGVITVNQELAHWCTSKLRISRAPVCYIKNPVCDEQNSEEVSPELPGSPGARIICVANFRPEKDHPTLLRAMVRVVRAVPEAHLMIAGKCNDAAYLDNVRNQIVELGLDKHVTILGERHDVPAILRNCDVGVLSSVSEGLPMSLLEYGMAGLPTVATEAGQCAEVLNYGVAGILIPPGEADRLADGLTSLLQRPEMRAVLGRRFQSFVQRKFSSDRIIGQVCDMYEAITPRHRKRFPAHGAAL